MSPLDDFYGPNAGYVAELLERYQRDPGGLDEATRRELAAWLERPAEEPATRAIPGVEVAGAAAAAELAQNIRLYGHRVALLDPLGGAPAADPPLEAHGLTGADRARLPASGCGRPRARPRRGTGAAARHARRPPACRRRGSGFTEVRAPAGPAWLPAAVVGAGARAPIEPDAERALLQRLTVVSAFERSKR